MVEHGNTTDNAASEVRIIDGGWTAADIDVGGVEIVAIGDVHGRSDLLKPLMAALETAAGPEATVIFLGDLVDRGPDSRGCLRLAAAGLEGRATHWLMGNHEAMLLSALNAYVDVPEHIVKHWQWLWRKNGGVTMLAEFSSLEMLAELTVAERMVLGNLKPHLRFGNTLFVHAGVSPSCLDGNPDSPAFDETALSAFLTRHPLDVDTDEYHPLWIRRLFLGAFEQIEKGPLVVHGHTPAPTDAHLGGRPYRDGRDIRITGRRLNIDAGSYATGEVAAAILMDGRYRVIHVHGSSPS